jgi:hypothetical protein
VSFPIFDTQGRAIAALTVPYAERIDQRQRISIPEVTDALRTAANTLSARVGGAAHSIPLAERPSPLSSVLPASGARSK